MQIISQLLRQANDSPGNLRRSGQPPSTVRRSASWLTMSLLVAGVLATGNARAWDEPAAGKATSVKAAQENRVLTAAQKQQVLGWIKDLGNRQYTKRQQAQTNLLRTGWPALPHLNRVHQDSNPERRFRARQLTREIQHRRSYREFQQLGQQPENAIDLDKAMYAIARIVNPHVDTVNLDRQLDQLASQVRKKLGPNLSAGKVAPERAVAVIQQVLFQEHGLTGEQANYDHPNNSSLEKVLKSRKGLPILLSHIVVSVADRVDLPFVGVAVPGRYMVKYDGSRAPAGTTREDILLDPFAGGGILTLDQLLKMIPSLERETALIASPKRDTVVRMLRNLESDYLQMDDLQKAEQTASYRRLVER